MNKLPDQSDQPGLDEARPAIYSGLLVRPMCVLLYCWLIMALPLLIYGFPHPTHDGEIHARWYSSFARQFWSGDFYPRWLIEMNDGFGSPAFFFYPPVPYWVSSILYLLPGDAAQAWRQLGLSAALGLLLSGVTMRLWLNEITSPRAALAGAILYMAAPYHLGVDLYTRGAFAEFWAFAWLPLILYFTHRLVKGEVDGRTKADRNVRAPEKEERERNRARWAFSGLAVSYALLVMTHLPSTLIFSIVPVLYAAVIASPRERLKALVATELAMGLGAGLAAVYLAPALFLQDAVSMEAMWTGHFYYENAFFFPHFEGKIARSAFDASVFWVTAATFAPAVWACLFLRRLGDKSGVRMAVFWLGLAGFSVFMMTPVSKPLWMLFPKLQLVQFPWRFNLLLTFSMAAVLGLALRHLRFDGKPANIAWTTASGALLLLWLPMTFQAISASFPGPSPWLDESHAAARIRHRDVPEYRPRWARSAVRRDIVFGPRGAETFHAKILSGEGRVSLEEWRQRKISLAVDAETELTVAVRQFYFPGWRGFDSESKQAIAVTPADPKGMVTFQVPKGRRRVELRLEATRAEWIGRAISGISGALLLSMMLFRDARGARID